MKLHRPECHVHRATVAWAQLCVCALICAQVYAHPTCDLEVAGSALGWIARGEQTGKGVAHDVRRDPFAALAAHVVGERLSEIVAVSAPAVRAFGMQHERLTKAVRVFNPGDEFLAGLDVAFRQVLELDGIGFAHVDHVGFEIEPPGDGLDYFEGAHAGMESTVEDVFEIVPRAFVDEFSHELRGAEIATRRLWRGLDLYGETWIVVGESFFYGPVEEAADGHVVPVG